MHVNSSLQRITDFHGHICPDLALGIKLCDYIKQVMVNSNVDFSDFIIVSENTTSALDAIQVLLGATVGNQRLLVMDFGKHNYTLYNKAKTIGYQLKMKRLENVAEEVFQQLEYKIIRNEALLNEILQYQTILDERVTKILSLKVEEMFDIGETSENVVPQETASIFISCSCCGEQVLLSRSVENNDNIYCMPCFRKIFPACQHLGMH